MSSRVSVIFWKGKNSQCKSLQMMTDGELLKLVADVKGVLKERERLASIEAQTEQLVVAHGGSD